MYTTPAPAAVQQVMRDTGMGVLQATHHLQSRERARELNAARARQFPLGSNQSIDHDAEYAAWAAKYPELAARHKM